MQTKFQKAEKLRAELSTLKNLRESVSNNRFKIFSDSELEELEHNVELKISFMPMTAETFNRHFFNNVNRKIDELTLELDGLFK